MATDIDLISAATARVQALDYQGPETREVLLRLGSLAWVVKKDQAERNKERLKEAETRAKVPEFLRCAADYQDAPHGTEVAKRFGSGWWRKVDDGWIDESCTVMPGSRIATAPREVLKWGDA